MSTKKSFGKKTSFFAKLFFCAMKKVSVPLNHPFWYPSRVFIYNDHFVRVSDVCLMACGCPHKNFASWLAHNNYTKKLPGGSQRYNYVSLDNVGRTIVQYFNLTTGNPRWNKDNMKEAIEEIKQSVKQAKQAKKRVRRVVDDEEEEEEEKEEAEKEEKKQKSKKEIQEPRDMIDLVSMSSSSISSESLDAMPFEESPPSPPLTRRGEEENEEVSPLAPAADAAGAAEAADPPSWWHCFRMRAEALMGPMADDSAFGPVEQDMPEQAREFLQKLKFQNH